MNDKNKDVMAHGRDCASSAAFDYPSNLQQVNSTGNRKQYRMAKGRCHCENEQAYPSPHVTDGARSANNSAIRSGSPARLTLSIHSGETT
jgi:hypothetical protein